MMLTLHKHRAQTQWLWVDAGTNAVDEVDVDEVEILEDEEEEATALIGLRP